MTDSMTLADVIRTLDLKPHPEGGWYIQTHRVPDPHDHGHRSPGTAIYYLLGEGERSHWHKVDATEIWHYYAGAPLELSLAVTEKSKPKTRVLGPDLAAGQRHTAGRAAGASLAGRTHTWRVDAGGMHRVAGLRFCRGFVMAAAGLVAGSR